MEKLIEYSKINILRLVQRANNLGLIDNHNENDYADYIHELWTSMLKNKELGEEAKRVDSIMGRGDSIQILSDTLEDASFPELEFY
ncbi:MAG: hypothetical protein V7767_09910 [Leeuwenhoekiella sp.]